MFTFSHAVQLQLAVAATQLVADLLDVEENGNNTGSPRSRRA